MKNVVYVLHDGMMNGWFIFNSRFSDLRADLHITAHVCGTLLLHGNRSWSRPLYERLFIKQNIFFGHISLLDSRAVKKKK